MYIYIFDSEINIYACPTANIYTHTYTQTHTHTHTHTHSLISYITTSNRTPIVSPALITQQYYIASVMSHPSDDSSLSVTIVVVNIVVGVFTIIVVISL